MCGIVGGIAERNVTEILLEGLKRLEYRGYDSAGVAVINADNQLLRTRRSPTRCTRARAPPPRRNGRPRSLSRP